MIRFCARCVSLLLDSRSRERRPPYTRFGGYRQRRRVLHPSRRRERVAPRGCPGRGRQRQRSEHIFYVGKRPHKKGSAFTANNMHASVAALMGRRAVRESFTALTTKLSKKSGYYKGKRSVSPGWHEKKVGGGGKGRFVLLDWKKPTYVIPEGLNEFTLKAYVAKGVTK